MPRILKRPMFSRGGSTNENNGIMDGLVDRTEKNQGGRIGYAEGKTQAEIYADEYYDQLSKIQPPKSRLNLGKVGLNLAAGKYSGGDLISTLAGAGSDIYDDYTAKDDVRRNLDYKTKMASAKMGISKADAEAAAKAKALATGKTPTLKQARNTTTQVLFGVEPGKTGYFTTNQLIAAQGLLAPVDNRMSFTFDATNNTLTQLPLGEVERIDGNKAKAKEIVATVNTVEELKNNMLSRLNETPTGLVGSVFGVFEGVSDQFSQATQALGFNKDSLDFDLNNSEKLDKYLEDKGITKGAANFATMKSSVTNLAYMLAKIKEPGNPKLSEGDIIRQMDRIKFGASRDVFAAGLTQIFEDELIGARGQIKGYDLDPDDYFNTGKNDTNTSSGNPKAKGTNDPAGIR